MEECLQRDRPVSISVGGKTFACRLSLLQRFPDALLWKAYMFNADNFDTNFWDRNPRVFEHLLEFYRTNRLSLPSDVSHRTIREELHFWGFDVELPERPSWPVLPPYTINGASTATAPNTIRFPLGVALRDASSGCHQVLICVVWSALGNSTCVWEAAQRGYRSICVYWKTRAPGVDSTIVKNNFRTLQHLAEMDGCTVQMLGPTHTANLSTEVRNHDVYTHGHLHSSGASTHVAEYTLKVSLLQDGHEVVMTTVSQDTLVFSFDHCGFRITFHMLGERIWWYMNPLYLGEEVVDSDLDVRTIETSKGFILEVSFVIGTSLLSGFILPNSYYRMNRLRSDMLLIQTFHDVPDKEHWYRASNRRHIRHETNSFDFIAHVDSLFQTDMILLVEEKQDVSLVCHPVSNIVPFTPTLSFSQHAYDRLQIEW